MPFKSLVATVIVLLTVSGCAASASRNTSYAQPPEPGGGIRIPIN